MIYNEDELQLKGYLENNEHLLWVGKPRTGVVFRNSDILVIPFSILWCGFAIFWEIGASRGSIIFALFGMPFVIIGLIFVFGRFIIDAKNRQNTIYGLTEDRIIIKSGIFNKSLKSLNIRTLSDIEYTEKADGTGTISIGAKNPFMMGVEGMSWWPGAKTNPSLEMIPEVRKVYSQIIELQKKK